MPPQLPQPYTQTLSLLRKIDLIQLSLEFKLPTDGSVVNLRDRLRVYLNAHRDTLFRNPRYNPLFPKMRRPPQRPALPASSASAPTLSYRTPSPDGSVSSDSSVHSYESWNGIEANPHPLNQQPQLHPPPLHPHPVHPPPVIVHQDPVAQFHPPPSPSLPSSNPGSPPPNDMIPEPRKSPFFDPSSSRSHRVHARYICTFTIIPIPHIIVVRLFPLPLPIRFSHYPPTPQ
jgi:hypothetical protein